MEARTGGETILSATLVSHPSTGPGPISRLTVFMQRRGETLWLRFVVDGDVNHVRWPALGEPGHADQLWTQTCFEVFAETADGYREYNLSPSGQWASYGFSGYRQGMAQAAESATVSGLDGAEDMVALEALIDLPESAGRLGLSAVIETDDGGRTYWALTHPADAPDFHHPDSFAVSVPEPA